MPMQSSAFAMAWPDEIWITDFGHPLPGEPAHHRPAVVIGPATVFGPSFPFVIVAPMTTTRRGLSLHVEVEPGGESGLDELSYVQCELLRSISRRRLIVKLGVVDWATSVAIDRVARVLLGH